MYIYAFMYLCNNSAADNGGGTLWMPAPSCRDLLCLAWLLSWWTLHPPNLLKSHIILYNDNDGDTYHCEHLHLHNFFKIHLFDVCFLWRPRPRMAGLSGQFQGRVAPSQVPESKILLRTIPYSCFRVSDLVREEALYDKLTSHQIPCQVFSYPSSSNFTPVNGSVGRSVVVLK